MEWNEFKGNMKVVLGIVISEKVFKVIDENDNRYAEGREALDKCWAWVEDREIGGDDLYEIIDNAECTGISEFSEKEDDLNIARVWSLLVDTVAYTSWAAYMKENAKYLPQMLDGIEEESIIVLIESALETGFISQEEVNIIMKQVLQYFKLVMGNSVDKKEIMKNMEENGIMEIERSQPNGNDMLNEKLQAVKEMNALFGEEINDGATEKEIQVFLQNISDENNDKFLEQYVKILKIVNGLEFNGFIIYGIDKYLLDKKPKQAINGFIDNNEVWHENEWQKKYIFIGDSSISWYVYDLDTNKFCELDKPGGKVINVFENIELIIIKILEDALQ